MFDCRWFKSSFRVMAAVLSLALLCGAMPFVPVSAADEVVFGVLSDVHLTKASTDWERQARFEMALEYYKERGAKVIVANADINDLGEAEAYDKFMAIWDKVFPDPAVAPKLLVTGDNHEWYGAWNFREAGTSANNTTIEVKQQMFMDGLRLTSTNNATVVDGYHFIAFSSDGFQPNTSCAYYKPETIAWLTEQLAAAAAESNTRPIYVFMHQPPTGTVVAAEVNDQLSYLFDQYPQIVMFTSHTHAPLEDERNIYQKNYTVVNTGSIYKNAEAVLASVSGDTTTIKRFMMNERKGVSQIKYDWVIEDPSDKSAYVYTPENYAASAVAPQFPADAQIAATALANNRLMVSFTAAKAQAATGPSDFVYRYAITVKKGGVTYTTASVNSDFTRDVSDMADALACVVTLPGNMSIGTSYEITVAPQDCYGNSGAALTATYAHQYKSPAKMAALATKFDEAGETSAEGISTGFSITVDVDTMPTVDTVDLSWDYHLMGVPGEGGVYLNGEVMDNVLLYKSWQNRFKVHLPAAQYAVGDVITVRGWFQPENIAAWPTGYTADWRAFFLESSYEFVGDHWEQLYYDECGYSNRNVLPIESAELSLARQTGVKPSIHTRHNYAVVNDVLPLTAGLEAVTGGIYVNGALDENGSLIKVGDGEYDLSFTKPVADGTTITVDGLFTYGGYYIRMEKMSIVYDAETDSWNYASESDKPSAAPENNENATNGTLVLSDMNALMGGSYGDNVYYELQANFNAANWIVNATPTSGSVTFEYEVNSESRTNAVSTFGVAYLADLASNYITPYGGTNFIANSGNTTTFFTQKQTPHLTLKLDVETFVPTVNGGAVSPYVTTEWSRYHNGETIDSSSVAAFMSALHRKGAQYFGLGWNGGNFTADFAKLMIYDENHNDLGVTSHATGRDLWNVSLKADYDAAVYVRPAVKSGKEVAGLRFLDEDGGELDIKATDEGNGVWSFVMTPEIYMVSAVYDIPSTKVHFTFSPDSAWQATQNRYLLYFTHDLGSNLSIPYGAYDVISIDGVNCAATCTVSGGGNLMILLNAGVGITAAGEHKVVLRGGTYIGEYKIAEDVVLYTHTTHPMVDQTPPKAADLVEVKGAQVTLGDDLTVDYTLWLDAVLDPSALTATVTYSGYTATTALGEADTDGFYHLFVDVPAKDIASTITVTIADNSKTYLTKTHSVRAYGEAILNGNYRDAEKAAAKAMLNYGAAAQNYFGYNVSDLANENCAYTSEQLNAADVSKVAPLQIEEGLSSYLGATLLLNGKTSIRLYFSEAVIGSTQNGSRYYVEVADLGADDLKTVQIVKIGDATYTFSALSFAKAVIEGDYGEEFQVLMKALVLYADAAEQL